MYVQVQGHPEVPVSWEACRFESAAWSRHDYIPYVDTCITFPLSPFLQAVVNHCKVLLSQFPPVAVDHILTFSALCAECDAVPIVPLFLNWFHIYPMTTDRTRVLVASR